MAPQLGKKGFSSHHKKTKAINVGDLAKLATENGELNLRKLGYNKLLGTGRISLKLTINVENYSARAEEKIKAAGGEIISIEPASEKKEQKKETEK
jgi:large subunit ribosomal protein L15